MRHGRSTDSNLPTEATALPTPPRHAPPLSASGLASPQITRRSLYRLNGTRRGPVCWMRTASYQGAPRPCCGPANIDRVYNRPVKPAMGICRRTRSLLEWWDGCRLGSKPVGKNDNHQQRQTISVSKYGASVGVRDSRADTPCHLLVPDGFQSRGAARACECDSSTPSCRDPSEAVSCAVSLTKERARTHCGRLAGEMSTHVCRNVFATTPLIRSITSVNGSAASLLGIYGVLMASNNVVHQVIEAVVTADGSR